MYYKNTEQLNIPSKIIHLTAADLIRIYIYINRYKYVNVVTYAFIRSAPNEQKIFLLL